MPKFKLHIDHHLIGWVRKEEITITAQDEESAKSIFIYDHKMVMEIGKDGLPVRINRTGYEITGCDELI